MAGGRSRGWSRRVGGRVRRASPTAAGRLRPRRVSRSRPPRAAHHAAGVRRRRPSCGRANLASGTLAEALARLDRCGRFLTADTDPRRRGVLPLRRFQHPGARFGRVVAVGSRFRRTMQPLAPRPWRLRRGFAERAVRAGRIRRAFRPLALRRRRRSGGCGRTSGASPGFGYLAVQDAVQSPTPLPWWPRARGHRFDDPRRMEAPQCPR